MAKERAAPMDKARQQMFIEALTLKGVKQPCPRCLNQRFEIVGEATIPLHMQDQEPGSFVIGGPAIPVVLVACTSCGYLTHHAVGALGIKAG